MKKLFLFIIIAEFVFAACGNLQTDKVRGFIPGVYVKEINDEYTKGKDTLIISIIDKKSGSYTIVRKTTYQQFIDGKTLSPKNDRHKWIAIYIPDTKQLKEQNQGRVFSFSPDKALLSMGSSEYRKISNE